MNPARRTFPDLHPRAFQHPLDRSALAALENVRGLDWVVRKFLSSLGERSVRLLFLASAVRVGPRQFPRLEALLAEACETLDAPEVPELYVAGRPVANAFAVGVDRPFVVVTSSIVDWMDDDEIRCVLGHEVGHILCGHALYTTVLDLLLRLWHLFLGIPGGVVALTALRMALLEWSRKAELTADRAGLLVAQDVEVGTRVDMKLAGGPRHEEMDVEEFLRQAQEFEAHGDLVDGALKLALLADRTHPLPVLRVAELHRWAGSVEYREILGGSYPRRSEVGASDRRWADEGASAAGSYRRTLAESTDPLLTTLRDLGAGAFATGSDLLDLLRGQGGDGEDSSETGR